MKVLFISHHIQRPLLVFSFITANDLYGYGNAHHMWQGRFRALGPSHEVLPRYMTLPSIIGRMGGDFRMEDEGIKRGFKMATEGIKTAYIVYVSI